MVRHPVTVGARGPARPRRSLAADRCPLPRGSVRLTVRGRRLVTAFALASGLGLAALTGASVPDGLPGGRTGGQLQLAGRSAVVVEPGDTVWSIAASVAGDGDVRAVVHRIRELNAMETTDILPGQVLRLP